MGSRIIIHFVLITVLLSPFAFAGNQKIMKEKVTLAKNVSSRGDRGPRMKGSSIDPFSGLTDAERSAILSDVLNSEPVKTELRGSRYRVFGIQATAVKTSEGLRRYSYTLLYDYTHNKTYNIVNDVSAGAPGKILEVNKPSTQPPPNREEYTEAKQLVAALDRVKNLLLQPSVKLQESFPVDSPEPCDLDRCIEIQVNDIVPGKHLNFLLLVTVDLSTLQIVEVREPKSPTSIR
jgi:hypothetical protein